MALKVADKCRWKTQKRTFIQWSIWSKATRRKNLVTASEDWIQALPGQSQMSQPPGRDPKSNARQRGSFLLSNPVPLPALPPRGIYIDRCIMAELITNEECQFVRAVRSWSASLWSIFMCHYSKKQLLKHMKVSSRQFDHQYQMHPRQDSPLYLACWMNL